MKDEDFGNINIKISGTGDRTWTCTVKLLGPKPSASANSATPAYNIYLDCIIN